MGYAVVGAQWSIVNIMGNSKVTVLYEECPICEVLFNPHETGTKFCSACTEEMDRSDKGPPELNFEDE
jgi:hypothetical protein